MPKNNIATNILNYINSTGPKNIYSVFGAGGKTTFIQKLENELYLKKIPHLVSFTTKIGQNQFQNLKRQEINNYEELEKAGQEALNGQRILLYAPTNNEDLKNKKLSGLASKYLSYLSFKFPKLKILIETDGAKEKPFKIHAPYEPIFTSENNEIRIAIIGLKALEKPLKESTHRYEYLKEKFIENEVLSPKNLALIILEYWTKYKIDFLFLNQADTNKRILLGKELKSLLEQSNVNYKIILSSFFNHHHL